jgi:hypothetical protein
MDQYLELYSEILPGLWQGGTHDEDTTLGVMNGKTKPKVIGVSDFQTLVTAYAFANPADWLVKELRYSFYDSDNLGGIDFDSINQIIDIAHADWKAGKKVGCAAKSELT